MRENVVKESACGTARNGAMTNAAAIMTIMAATSFGF